MVTLINVFEVPPDRLEDFVEGWRTRAAIMASAQGFRDTCLHRAVSPGARFTLVNVAHWDSQADLEAAQANPAFRAAAPTGARAVANPAVYEVVAEFSA
jgi:heme-degrading monooxygenase HmoA